MVSYRNVWRCYVRRHVSRRFDVIVDLCIGISQWGFPNGTCFFCVPLTARGTVVGTNRLFVSVLL